MSKGKKLIIGIIALLLILLFPIPVGPYKDGGSIEFCALTYKVIKWNRLTDVHGTEFKKLSFYPVPYNFSSISELWEYENAGCLTGEPPFYTFGSTGSETEGLELEYIGADIFAFEPYIELKVTNTSATEKSIGNYYDILRSTGGKYVSCMTEQMGFDQEMIILKPNEEYSKKYDVSKFDFSVTGDYRFVTGFNGKQLWFDFRIDY